MMTTKQQHARIVRMFATDIQMTKENTAQIIEMYEADKMKDDARAAFDALLAFAGELSDKPMTNFEFCAANYTDIFRIWKQLWGERTPEQVANYSDQTGGDAYDQTQLTDREIAETE